MASIFGFRTRSADRDDTTDAQRLARIKALIAQVAAEIEAESAGLEKRCRNQATDAGFLVEAIDNAEVSARSEARVDELTSSLLRVMGPATEDGGRNKMGVVNDVGYGYVQKAMSEVDRSAQCAALQGAQKSFLQRVDAIPLAVLPTTIITASGVGIRQFDDYVDPATVRIDG